MIKITEEKEQDKKLEKKYTEAEAKMMANKWPKSITIKDIQLGLRRLKRNFKKEIMN